MANTAVKFGFRHIGYLPGFAPDYQMQSGIILSSNSTKIFRGDPISIDPATGAVVQGANNTSTLLGVFDGCMYTPVGGTPQWSPMWPGAAGSPATAYYINSPGALFLAAALNTSLVTANIGENVGFVIGTGNTATGGSAATLDQSTLGATITLPFRVVDLGSKYLAAGSNGADVGSAFAWAVVAFNNQQYKTQTAVV